MISAATYSALINPENSTQDLAGFVRRKMVKDQIGPEDLYVKIVWLDFSAEALILISLDTLYFPQELAEKVGSYCAAEFNIGDKNIIFNATHTHAAPNIALPFFGKIDGQYCEQIFSEIQQGLRFCYENKSKVMLKTDEIPIGSKIIGRRKVGRDIKSFFLKRKMLLLPNESQEIDRTIRTIEIANLEGDVLANIVNFSCHPVFANTLSQSADFPGQITHELSVRNGGVAMFVQGYCGDVRPNYVSTSFFDRSILNFFKKLFNGIIFAPLTQVEFSDFCTDILKRINSREKEGDEVPANTTIVARSFEFEMFSGSRKTSKKFTVRIVVLNNLILVSIPAEVNSKYYTKLKESFPEYTVWPLGFGQGMIGYLPFPSEINEGGYEVSSAVNYGWDTIMDKMCCEEFVNKLVFEVGDAISK